MNPASGMNPEDVGDKPRRYGFFVLFGFVASGFTPDVSFDWEDVADKPRRYGKKRRG